MIRVHGSSVTVGDDGILLRGPSGSGKSDLALRLIDGGAALVADDQTELTRVGARLRMTAPAALRGLLEVRGLGIVRVPAAAGAFLALVVDLVDGDAVERLPEPRTCTLDGVEVPLLELAPFAASAPAKVRLALRTMGQPRAAGALAVP